MELVVFVVVATAAIVTGLIVERRVSQKRFEKGIEGRFGEVPSELTRFELESIRAYWGNLEGCDDGEQSGVDAITWNDLDMDQVFSRINACMSSAGEEYLYYILHKTHHTGRRLREWETLMRHLGENPQKRLELQVLLSRLGKFYYNHAATMFADTGQHKLKHTWVYRVCAMLPLAMLAFVAVSVPLGIVLAVATAAGNGILYHFTERKIENGLKANRYLSAVLDCAGKLLKRKDEHINEFLPHLAGGYNMLRRKLKQTSGVATQSSMDLDVLTMYARYVSLWDIIQYNKTVNAIEKNRDAVRALYENIGELDTLISVMSFRKSLTYCTAPEFCTEKKLTVKELYHPLLGKPVANSLDTPKGCIITGSNASGKSTFIKALAINCILAQTIHTCTANAFMLPFNRVITSMAVRDNVTGGESYFVVEVKSLKRIINAVNEELPCYCFIDEILRGTNTVERIAASASFLRYVAKRNVLCMAASHDIELTELMKGDYGNYHFSERITQNEIVFDYRLKEGAADTRNAIRLLEYLGFDPQIPADAERMVAKFQKEHSW